MIMVQLSQAHKETRNRSTHRINLCTFCNPHYFVLFAEHVDQPLKRLICRDCERKISPQMMKTHRRQRCLLSSSNRGPFTLGALDRIGAELSARSKRMAKFRSPMFLLSESQRAEWMREYVLWRQQADIVTPFRFLFGSARAPRGLSTFQDLDSRVLKGLCGVLRGFGATSLRQIAYDLKLVMAVVAFYRDARKTKAARQYQVIDCLVGLVGLDGLDGLDG